MNKKIPLLVGVLVLSALLLAACAGAPTPTAAPAPTLVKSAATTTPAPLATRPATPSIEFESERNSGGSVTVDVRPSHLVIGEAVAFNVAMNTHSVDLSDDMTQISILRDDTGKEYLPTAWEGPGGGGHHRSGSLSFPALTGKPKSVQLVIKGLAGVPERVFKWNLP